MRIRDILQVIESLAPLSLQEGFDNCGLQIGDANREATGALVSLDVTESVVDEAARLGCNLIVSHHPLIFRPFKSLTGKNDVERCMMKAVKRDVCVYAAHTNLDNAYGGVNFKLAELLGLRQVRVLSPQKGQLIKLVTFVPQAHADSVRSALFNAGAGNIGEYDSCSYNLQGVGTFKAKEEANPFVGRVGELHLENEVRIETILPRFRQTEVLRALISVHPYEEAAYDLYPLENEWTRAGSGVVGILPEPMPEQEFLFWVKDTLNLPVLKHSKHIGREIHDVALCGGSGAFLINQAIAYGADAFITGEAKYNDYYDVEDKILLAVAGHFETEVCTKDIIFDVITKKYPNFAVHKSAFDLNPVNYL